MKRSLCGFAVAGALALGGGAAWANPVMVGPPPLVDGKPVPMPTVKKWGQYWYPATLVGFNRGIEFAFDRATNTLYADGSVLEMDTIVIDDVVYIPLQPVVTNSDMRPGMAALRARRGKYEAMQQGRPEAEGSMDELFMEDSVDMPEHPWAEGESWVPTGPIIDLDPTGSTATPAHLRPAALPVNRSSTPLPGHLPPPSIQPPAPAQEATYAPSHEGVPLRISSKGGPQAPEVQPQAALASNSSPAQISSHPNGLQPIPVSAPQSNTAGLPQAGITAINPSKGRNQAFEVSVLSASLKNSATDRLLALKLNQRNLSPVAQANLGTFALRCQDGSRVEPVQSRSVMPDGTLAPGGVREGELLFRLGPTAEPTALELEGTLPLSVILDH